MGKENADFGGFEEQGSGFLPGQEAGVIRKKY